MSRVCVCVCVRVCLFVCVSVCVYVCVYVLYIHVYQVTDEAPELRLPLLEAIPWQVLGSLAFTFFLFYFFLKKTFVLRF